MPTGASRKMVRIRSDWRSSTTRSCARTSWASTRASSSRELKGFTR